LRVVSADSGAAVLSDRFEPLSVVALSAVLVEPPYRGASLQVAEPVFAGVEEGPSLVVRELRLCQGLLEEAEVEADVVHLDMTLNGLSVADLSPVDLSEMRLSAKARKQILGILPKLRKAASEIRRSRGIEVLALGKSSVPVRIAELTSGAHAILYSAERALEQKARLVLGLPTNCQPTLFHGGVTLRSLEPSEHDLAGHARDEKGHLERVQVLEMLNPCLRGFRAVEIRPKP